jgi:hypothetical protein
MARLINEDELHRQIKDAIRLTDGIDALMVKLGL